MTYRCIDYTGDRAVVVVTPSWLARMLGARDVAIDIIHDAGDLYSKPKWRYVVSGREVGESILNAIDKREIGEIRRTKPSTGGKVAP